MTEWALDVALVLLIVGIAWRCLTESDLFAASVAYIAFGLTLALAWARLGAPDVALAEAALGAGITGALLVDAARRLQRPPHRDADAEDDDGAH